MFTRLFPRDTFVRTAIFSLSLISFLAIGLVGYANFSKSNNVADAACWSFRNQKPECTSSSNTTNTNQNYSSTNNFAQQTLTKTYNFNECSSLYLQNKILVCSVQYEPYTIYYSNSQCVSGANAARYIFSDGSTVLDYRNGYKIMLSGDYCKSTNSNYYTSYYDASRYSPEVIYLTVNVPNISYTSPRTSTASITYNPDFRNSTPNSTSTQNSAFGTDVYVPTTSEYQLNTSNDFYTNNSASLPVYDWVDYKAGNKQSLSLTTYNGKENQTLINNTNAYSRKYNYTPGSTDMIESLKKNEVLYCGSGSSVKCSRWAIDFEKYSTISH